MNWNKDALEIHRGVSQFCAKHVRPEDAAHWHKEGHIPSDKMFRLMAEAGITTIGIPEELGGFGGTLLMKCAAGRRLAQADAALMLETAGHGLFRGHFLRAANKEQLARVIPDLLAGARGAWALTGPDGGSKPYTSGTRASKVAGGWVLNGNRDFITGARSAKWVLVMAVTEGKNMTAFLVQQGAKGFSTSEPYDKVSMPGTETVSVQCDDLFVPDTDVVGKVHGAMTDIMANLTEGRMYITSGALGIIDAALESLDSWMRDRKSGDTALQDLGELGAKRAEIWCSQVAGSALIADVCALDPQDQRTQMLATAAKLYVSEAAMKAALDCAIIHGGSGVVREQKASRLWVDMMVFIVGEGCNPTLRTILNRYLTKNSAF